MKKNADDCLEYLSMPGGKLLELGDHFNSIHGRIVPFQYATPRMYSAKLLHDIGVDGARIVARNIASRKPYILAIENKGTPIATSILLNLMDIGIDATLSISNKIDELVSSYINDDYLIVVDNSIITGNTVRSVLQRLAEHGIYVDLIIALFDYCHINPEGLDIVNELKTSFDTNIEFIYKITDYLEHIPKSHLMAINDYYIAHGVPRFFKLKNEKHRHE